MLFYTTFSKTQNANRSGNCLMMWSSNKLKQRKSYSVIFKGLIVWSVKSLKLLRKTISRLNKLRVISSLKQYCRWSRTTILYTDVSLWCALSSNYFTWVSQDPRTSCWSMTTRMKWDDPYKSIGSRPTQLTLSARRWLCKLCLLTCKKRWGWSIHLT